MISQSIASDMETCTGAQGSFRHRIERYFYTTLRGTRINRENKHSLQALDPAGFLRRRGLLGWDCNITQLSHARNVITDDGSIKRLNHHYPHYPHLPYHYIAFARFFIPEQ